MKAKQKWVYFPLYLLKDLFIYLFLFLFVIFSLIFISLFFILYYYFLFIYYKLEMFQKLKLRQLNNNSCWMKCSWRIFSIYFLLFILSIYFL